MDLFLTREKSGVSNSGFSEKNSTSLSFLVKSLMDFSISGKLRAEVGVNFKPLLKIWICEGVKLTLDKLTTLGWIISSYFGWLSLHLTHEEKDYLLQNCSHFLLLGCSEDLAYLAQLWYIHFVPHYYTFTIILTFHRFKSFFLSLFIWSYFTKKWLLFSPLQFFSSWARCNESQPKEELIIHSNVVNSSSVSLTPSQIQNLSKGLKFTPTSARNLPEMEKSIKDFTRKLRLVEFFSENPELDTPDFSLVKNKSNFCPPQNWNSPLESVIKFLQKQSFYEKNLKISPTFQSMNGNIF